LILVGGFALRMDRNTAAVVHSGERLTLERGVLYVDSGSTRTKPPLQIETSIGIVRPRGTQFQVSLRNQSLSVSVREGAVAVDGSAGTWQVRSGERLVVGGQAAPERQAIARSGAEWAWISPLAESFVLEGATLTAFLDWVGREQGWRWRYGPAAPRPRRDDVILHGSVEGMTPEEALAAVLPTCGLEFEIDGDSLIIRSIKAR
jgi:ferric-dicitrate binding protein FerR (iron transport regulator)